MPSAFKSRNDHIAQFRPPRQTGAARRRIRLPGASKAQAEAHAHACETVSRKIEAYPTPELIRQALELRALTPAEAAAIRKRLPVQPPAKTGPLTLEQANDNHPSTQRERDKSPEDYARHCANLAAFQRHTGIDNAADLTLAQVLAWIRLLHQRGLAWDTRRHYLVPIRRAARMAASEGLPDPLGGLILDRQENPARVHTASLRAVYAALLKTEDPRARTALALGAFAGLRPSEILRAKIGDLDGEILQVGERAAKTRSSRRSIPLPEIVLAQIPDGEPAAPLVPTPTGLHWQRNNYAKWIAPHLAPLGLQTRHLRKSFATAMIDAGVAPNLVDAYLGHEIAGISQITARHYYASLTLRDLRAVSDAVNTITNGW